MMALRDRMWLWGHEPGSHNVEWGLPRPSRITPVEAAHYMGIPNVIMVRYGPEPLPPDAQYLVSFRSLNRVVWSLVGAGGMHEAADLDRVLAVAEALPNMTGVMMDDFFRPTGDGVISVEALRETQARLKRAARPLDLWVVLYDYQLGMPVRGHLEQCDTLTFWTWEARNLVHLEENFSRFETLAPPGCRKVLGLYMWDYGTHAPMPLDLMRHQCAFARHWLTEGRLDGIIFLASCICDLDLEAVEWTREWIRENG